MLVPRPRSNCSRRLVCGTGAVGVNVDCGLVVGEVSWQSSQAWRYHGGESSDRSIAEVAVGVLEASRFGDSIGGVLCRSPAKDLCLDGLCCRDGFVGS